MLALELQYKDYSFCLKSGRLRGLAVACWSTDHYHPCSNLGVGISEGCFVFHFASLPLEARLGPFNLPCVHKNGRKTSIIIIIICLKNWRMFVLFVKAQNNLCHVIFSCC